METKRKIAKEKAKKVIEKTTQRTVKLTKTVLIAIFVVMIIFTIIVSIIQFISQDLNAFITGIATLSIGGFWAFFLGYFGWRMGETVEASFGKIKKK